MFSANLGSPVTGLENQQGLLSQAISGRHDLTIKEVLGNLRLSIFSTSLNYNYMLNNIILLIHKSNWSTHQLWLTSNCFSQESAVR